MKQIELTKGYTTIVDDDDYELLAEFNWTCLDAGKWKYAVRYDSERCRQIRMHRQILGASKGIHVDHVNGDGLDNRRENIRFATPAQNCWNRRPLNLGKSKYRGVSWAGSSNSLNPWRAMIRVNNRKISLGCFKTELEAARAYNIAMVKHYGEFACADCTSSARRIDNA